MNKVISCEFSSCSAFNNPITMYHFKLLINLIVKNPLRCSIRRFSLSANRGFPITHAKASNFGNDLEVVFSDGHGQLNTFPALFLQDNCTCTECFHQSSQSRSRKMTQLNLNAFLKDVKFDSENVKCIWSDNHEAMFSENWLRQRRFTDDNIAYRTKGLRDAPTLIGADHDIHKVSFNDAMSDKAKLLSALNKLCQEGVVLITEAPQVVGQVRRIADKIGFIRLTHYGYEFTVKSEKNAVNLAYTSHTLCVHTDLPYYAYPPGVQLLHCIKQYEGDDGGRTHLVDGFLAADYMKRHHPKEFAVLHQVPVEFYDIGKDYIDFHKVHHSPTFVLCPRTGAMRRILYSNQQLSSYQPIPLEKVDDVYKALKLFTDLCYHPNHLIQFKLNEGDIVIFDNWRLLHGREGFDPSAGDRHLEGCYIDWDEIFSRIRLLQGQM